MFFYVFPLQKLLNISFGSFFKNKFSEERFLLRKIYTVLENSLILSCWKKKKNNFALTESMQSYEIFFFWLIGLCILKQINPNPHGHGRICPHCFQRPITQKVLKYKNLQKLSIPRKISAESMSWVMYPTKNVINACFMPQNRPMPEKCGLTV